MEPKQNELWQWAEAAAAYTPAEWERLPELELYMDQVITWLNRQLEPVDGGDKPLTSSMINNYVKGGVLPRPAGKKYTRDHLGLLMAVCMLKSELPLPAIRQLFAGLGEEMTVEQQYPLFASMQERALKAAAQKVESAKDGMPRELYILATELALQANAYRTAAERVLAALEPEPAESAEKKDKKKREEPAEE